MELIYLGLFGLLKNYHSFWSNSYACFVKIITLYHKVSKNIFKIYWCILNSFFYYMAKFVRFLKTCTVMGLIYWMFCIWYTVRKTYSKSFVFHNKHILDIYLNINCQLIQLRSYCKKNTFIEIIKFYKRLYFYIWSLYIFLLATCLSILCKIIKVQLCLSFLWTYNYYFLVF